MLSLSRSVLSLAHRRRRRRSFAAINRSLLAAVLFACATFDEPFPIRFGLVLFSPPRSNAVPALVDALGGLRRRTNPSAYTTELSALVAPSAGTGLLFEVDWCTGDPTYASRSPKHAPRGSTSKCTKTYKTLRAGMSACPPCRLLPHHYVETTKAAPPPLRARRTPTLEGAGRHCPRARFSGGRRQLGSLSA